MLRPIKTKTTFVLILTLVFATKTYSQNSANFYVSPGVSVGYTFGAAFNYGFDLDIGILQFQSPATPYNLGLSFSKYWTQFKKKTHRHRTANVMLESSFFDFKIGYGNVKNKWGYSGGNRCRTGGLNLDLSVTTKNIFVPWVGFKILLYDKYSWAWYDKYYKSAYLKYKYDFLNNSKIKVYNP